MLQKREKISEISALATNESTLESMLNRIVEIWKKTDFRLVKDQSKDTFIITGTDEIQILLEESQVRGKKEGILWIKWSHKCKHIKILKDHHVHNQIVEVHWSD